MGGLGGMLFESGTMRDAMGEAMSGLGFGDGRAEQIISQIMQGTDLSELGPIDNLRISVGQQGAERMSRQQHALAGERIAGARGDIPLSQIPEGDVLEGGQNLPTPRQNIWGSASSGSSSGFGRTQEVSNMDVAQFLGITGGSRGRQVEGVVSYNDNDDLTALGLPRTDERPDPNGRNAGSARRDRSFMSARDDALARAGGGGGEKSYLGFVVWIGLRLFIFCLTRCFFFGRHRFLAQHSRAGDELVPQRRGHGRAPEPEQGRS